MLEKARAVRNNMAVQLSRRVDFPMLDMAGIGFYPRIYDLAHRFFEDSWMEMCGLDYPHIIGEMKIGFPVVDIKSEFHAPFKYGDTINAKIWISKVGNKSCTWQYRFSNQNKELLWSSEQITVCVSMTNMDAIVIPDILRKGMEENCDE